MLALINDVTAAEARLIYSDGFHLLSIIPITKAPSHGDRGGGGLGGGGTPILLGFSVALHDRLDFPACHGGPFWATFLGVILG